MTKCAKEGCQQIAKKGQKYCSVSHAPLGLYGLGKDTRSEKTDVSTFKARGEDSAQFRPFGRPDGRNGMSQRTTQSSEKSSARSSESIITEIRPNETKLTVIGIDQNPNGGERKKMNNELNLPEKQTQGVRSVEPSQILEPVESDSMNSIDACVTQLTELMQSAKTSIGSCEKPTPYLPQVMNASANCASQIQKLLKLKIDIVRNK